MSEVKLTWHDVLDCKRDYAFIGDMAWAAVDAGYEYFVWDGCVYQCLDRVGESYEDTGILAENLG